MSDKENATATANEGKSIIDPKYAQKYKDKPKDWLGAFLDEHATTPVMKEKVVKDDEGKPVLGDDDKPKTESVETGQRNIDLDKLFAVAQANAVDTTKMEAQRDRPNAPGRIRMTLGNSLRAAARKRHGLYDADKNWIDADADFIGETPKTQNPDGSKIQVEKPKADADSGEAEAA